jgi:hypothetical protein
VADSNAEAQQWVKALSDSSASHGFPVTGPLKINTASVPLAPTSKIAATKSEDLVPPLPPFPTYL